VSGAAIIIVTALSTFSASNDRALSMLKDWIRAVDEHRPGDHDAALVRIAAWTYDDLDLMQAYIQAIAEVPLNTKPRQIRRQQLTQSDLFEIKERTKDLWARGFDRFRKRAVLLHTDVAMFGAEPLVVKRPPTVATRQPRDQDQRRVDVLSRDGQVERYQLANPHWEYARDLLDSLPKGQGRDPMVGKWYEAVGAHFLIQRQFAEAIAHFDVAHGVARDDPGVLFAEAWLQEILGSPRIQDYVRVSLQMGLNISGVSSPQTHFRTAAEMLQKALAARPDFVEARLRLGRILVEQKNYPEALEHLQRVATSTADATLRYYALLFSGDASLSLERPGDARTSYERALDLFPKAQAARLGLGASLRLLGERQTAIDAVMSTIMVAPDARDQRDEPWWEYYDGNNANVDRLLAALREPYLEPRQ
jgi:tetratricopeptide (TPR) repeat protein